MHRAARPSGVGHSTAGVDGVAIPSGSTRGVARLGMAGSAGQRIAAHSIAEHRTAGRLAHGSFRPSRSRQCSASRGSPWQCQAWLGAAGQATHGCGVVPDGMAGSLRLGSARLAGRSNDGVSESAWLGTAGAAQHGKAQLGRAQQVRHGWRCTVWPCGASRLRSTARPRVARLALLREVALGSCYARPRSARLATPSHLTFAH